MYRYDEFDARIVKDRVEQFRGQVTRRLSGELLEDEFKPLRLQNGVYLQLHAYMLRVAIPYGQLNGAKLRRLAEVSTKYDRGYGHFTTRQNIQYNWVGLKDIPDALNDLAEVELHAIQTSGNCIRNVTSDHFAGAAADEVMDPRPWCEIIRQWSTFHPEFAFPAAQVQIRGDGSRRRPGRDCRARYRPAHREARRCMSALKSMPAAGRGGRRFWPRWSMTLFRRRSFSIMSKPSCASTTAMAAGTTSTRRGSRSSSRSLARKSLRARWKRNTRPARA